MAGLTNNLGFMGGPGVEVSRADSSALCPFLTVEPPSPPVVESTEGWRELAALLAAVGGGRSTVDEAEEPQELPKNSLPSLAAHKGGTPWTSAPLADAAAEGKMSVGVAEAAAVLTVPIEAVGGSADVLTGVVLVVAVLSQDSITLM